MGEPWPELPEGSGVCAGSSNHLIGSLKEICLLTLYCTEKTLQLLLKHFDQFCSIHLSGSQTRLLLSILMLEKNTWPGKQQVPTPLLP